MWHQRLRTGNLCQNCWMQEAYIQQLLVHFTHKFCEVPLLKVSLCHHYCWAVLFDLQRCTRCTKYNMQVRYFHWEAGECSIGNLIMGKNSRSDSTRSFWLKTEQQPTAVAMTSQYGCVIDYANCNSHVRTVTVARHRQLLFAPLFKSMKIISIVLLGDLHTSQSAACYFLLLPNIFRNKKKKFDRGKKMCNTRWFKYGQDWFVFKQAALRSSCATLREWSHNLHPPSC